MLGYYAELDFDANHAPMQEPENWDGDEARTDLPETSGDLWDGLERYCF